MSGTLPDMTYRDCSAAYADGVAFIPRSDPAYALHLDGRTTAQHPHEPDGIACENPPAGFVARAPVRPKTDIPPAKREQSEAIATAPTPTSATVAEGRLPVTGTAADAALAGGGLLALGLALTVAVTRFRRRRFVA